MTDKEYEKQMKTIKKGVAAAALGIFGIVSLICSITVVPSGYTGVKSRMGQIQDEAVTSGVHFHLPFFETIKKISNKQTDVTYDGQCWCESSEQTPVFYEGVELSYQISPAASVFLYKNVDKNIVTDGKSLIPVNLVSSALKNASVQLVTRDVTKRACIEPLAVKELQAALDSRYGEGNVTVVRISIGNADFEQAYNDVIAERQAAQITYEKQQIENKTNIEKAEAEAKKKKIDAEGEAEAEKAKAEGEAAAIKTKADAQAEANEKLNKSLTGNIITNNFIDKWDGELPVVQGNEGLILDASKFIGETSSAPTSAESNSD